MVRQIIHLKKEVHTIKNKKVNNSTIETKFDQCGNKVLIFETIKEVDGETVTKDKSTLLTREPTASLLSGNVEYSNEIKHSLMIEGDVRDTRNPLVN